MRGKLIRYKGKELTIAQWSKRTGVPIRTINGRLEQDWPVEDLFKPAGYHTKKLIILYRGERKPLSVWAKILGLNPKTIHDRLDRGWDPVRALETPTHPFKIYHTEVKRENSDTLLDVLEQEKIERARPFVFYMFLRTIKKLREDFETEIPYYFESDFGKDQMNVA